jgi:hypothetical protein
MPHVYVEYIAIFIAVASLLLTGWKIWADRDVRKEWLAFERSERAVRENAERNERIKREAFELGVTDAIAADRQQSRDQRQDFEMSEREKREAFEASERTLRVRFMAGQDRALVEAESRIKNEIESYVKLEKWREETWQRNLTRLEQASKDLTGTTAGLISLIDEGPFYNDARMIQETARVLDVFGDFQTSVSHFAMPPEMSELSKALVGQVTKILLTLSPYEPIRKSEERKALLAPLRTELKVLSNLFISKCGDFERDPSAFFSEGAIATHRIGSSSTLRISPGRTELPIEK